MASILLRYGLWVVLIVLVAYVLRETFEGQAFAGMVSGSLLQKAGALGLLLIAAGAVVGIFEKLFSKKHSRCAICKQKIAYGEIYCRAHLREILSDEHDRLHKTQTQLRRPRGL